MKMYGFTKNLGFPCICYGSMAWCFKLIWLKEKKRFKWISWYSEVHNVWYHRDDTFPYRFFGYMILDKNAIYDSGSRIFNNN